MPRFTLHRSSSPAEQSASESRLEGRSQPTLENASLGGSPQIPEGLKTDSRLQLLGELPRMVLIECPRQVADEWLAKMPGWILKPESKASIPDPRPKLKKRLK